MANEFEKRCKELAARVTAAFGENFISLVLYGSAASGDFVGPYSDLNVLCVLKHLRPDELSAAEPIFRWWRGLENPSPLLMTRDEMLASADTFPIEFHDIREHHRILAGVDIVADLPIDDVFYRGRVEFELRSKLLRLRQKSVGVYSDKALLTKLLAESLSTFLNLARHAMRLSGIPASIHKRETAREAADAFGLDPTPFYTLLDLREGKRKPRDVEPHALFAVYLQQIESLVASVDRIQR